MLVDADEHQPQPEGSERQMMEAAGSSQDVGQGQRDVLWTNRLQVVASAAGSFIVFGLNGRLRDGVHQTCVASNGWGRLGCSESMWAGGWANCNPGASLLLLQCLAGRCLSIST